MAYDELTRAPNLGDTTASATSNGTPDALSLSDQPDTPRLSLASQPDAINGGRQAGYTLGVNWYPNSVLRFMLDYKHVDVDKSQTATVVGAPLRTNIGTRFNAISLRSQAVF